MFCFVMRCLTFVALVIGATWVSCSAAAEQKKYAGSLFDAVPQHPGTSAVPHSHAVVAPSAKIGPWGHGVSERSTLSSRSALPAIKVRVLVPAKKEVSPALLNLLTEESKKFAADSGKERQFTLRESSHWAIEKALGAPEVSRIEIFCPPRLAPSLPFAPRTHRPLNLDARITHCVPQFLATFSATTEHGKTVTGAVFDEGAILRSHVEFATDRVTLRTNKKPSEHSTHVAGTMAAKGVRAQAQGMARAMTLLSFDWDVDLDQLDSVGDGIVVSNHSYGPPAGWDWDSDRRVWFWYGNPTVNKVEDANFGKYTSDNRRLDAILVAHPHLVTFVAAGNDRNDGPESQPVDHYALVSDPTTAEAEAKVRWQVSRRERNRDGFDHGGLDTIAGLGLSKNAICIGAIDDVKDAAQPITTTDFSAWGPADDGRIKPDLVANGAGLLSTSKEDEEAYIELSGTSMASPTAAGIGALLIENFQKTKHRAPTSAEIKAVLIHSATEAGTPGPDPVYGWGSINALAAGRLIAGEKGQTIRTDSVGSGPAKTYNFTQPAQGTAVRATLVWIDPPAAPNAGGLDDATPALENDLDLEVRAPDGTVFFPYSLSTANPLAPATRNGPNRVDNVELVDAPALQGNWQVKVKATTLRTGSSQSFALVVSGLEEVP